MTKVCDHILSEPRVRDVLYGGQYDQIYICTRVAEMAEAFEKLTVGMEQGTKDILSRWMGDYCSRRLTSNLTGEQIVSHLIGQVIETQDNYKVGVDALKAAGKARAEEAKRRKEEELQKIEDERLKLEAVKEQEEKLRRELEAKRKQEAEEVAKDQLAKREAEEAARLAAQEVREKAELELDARAAASSVVGGDVEIATEEDFRDLPIAQMGLPGLLVSALSKAGFETAGQLSLYGETEGRDYTSIKGVGKTSADMIIETIGNLKAKIGS